MDKIRITCASVCRIKIGEFYYVLLNKSYRKKYNLNYYGAVGGAFEFYPDGECFLNEIGATLGENKDLRLFIPAEKIVEFRHWFDERVERECSPFREVYEELVIEEKVLDDLYIEDVLIKHYKSLSMFNETPKEPNVKDGFYLFEFFDVEFLKTDHVNKLIQSCFGELPKGKMLTRNDIIDSQVVLEPVKFSLF